MTKTLQETWAEQDARRALLQAEYVKALEDDDAAIKPDELVGLEIDFVARTKRICRGPLVYDEKLMKGRMVQWVAIEEAKDGKSAVLAIQELGETAQQAAQKLNPGFRLAIPELATDDEGNPMPPAAGDMWEALRRLALPLIRLRYARIGRPCGYDMTEQVLAEPFDGAEHKSECPKCGNEFSWRAPVFY